MYKVDKLLPGNIAALSAGNEWWVPYTEKAYAKRYQSYEARVKNGKGNGNKNNPVSKSGAGLGSKRTGFPFATLCEAINGGWGAWGLTDLTGGIAIRTKLDWHAGHIHELFAWLFENKQEILVTSSINNNYGHVREVLLANGLYGGHAYSVLDFEVVTDRTGQLIQLVNIRNPWGRGEFKGHWSDYSSKWDTLESPVGCLD